MSVLHFFIIPETVLTVGIVLIAVLSSKKERLAESKGDISIGSLNKEEILKLQQSEIKKLRNMVAVAFICSFLITALTALGAIVLSGASLTGLVICLPVQTLVVIVTGILLVKKANTFRHT